VDAVEFRPGNFKVVHHAAMRLDKTRLSRKRDAREPGPGFGGMTMPETTYMPNGQFLNWQPGKLPYRAPEVSWLLETNTDLVLQLHLKPDGKPEPVQCSVGFYFTARAPERQGFKIVLDNPTIDIPPGESNYQLEDSYVLPVDADVTAIFPHAHYLAREMQGFATLPDGTKKWLLLIKNWDFDWQGDYRFAHPVLLPKGTALHMLFTYDNSTNNVRNPNHPPKRVQFGMETTDEMGELWIQALPRREDDLAKLADDYSAKSIAKEVRVQKLRLEKNPNDAKARLQLGKALLGLQNFAEALPQFQLAANLNPTNADAHYFLGLAQRISQNRAAARSEFEKALQLDPDQYKAHGNLGVMDLEENNIASARQHFQDGLRINPDDAFCRENLGRVPK
jgi:hypothetical protein